MDNDSDIEFPKRGSYLAQIMTDPELARHKIMLEEWTREIKASERNLARKQASCSSSRSDLYQILGLFFVFQGVVLTAVAQANSLTCTNWYLPFILSLIVFIAALGASVQKLKELFLFSKQFDLEKSYYKALRRALDDLKELGPAFDVVERQPDLPPSYFEPVLQGSGAAASALSSVSRFCSVWIRSYAGAVLFVLCLFTVFILFSVRRVLCHHDNV